MSNLQIKEFIKTKSNRIFLNSNKELYKLLLKNIFENANSINLLLSNSEKAKLFFTQEWIDALKDYVKSGKEIKIILAR